MTEGDSVSKLIPGIAARDEEAMQQMVERYYGDLVRLARKKLVSMPQQVADDEGAVISALHSFFKGVEGEKFPKLDDRDDLWKVLATLTVRKATKQLRRHWKKSGERTKRERHEDLHSFLELGPGPQEATMIMDEFQVNMDRLEDESLREIATLRLAGFETKEIAEKLDVHQRTVQRKLLMISNSWLKSNED